MAEPVFFYKIKDYNDETLEEKIEKIISSVIKPELVKGKRVFIKPNLLTNRSPDQAVTTHPKVVFVVANYFVKKGAQVTIGDSPGGPGSAAWLKTVFRVSGIETVAEQTGAVLNFDLTPYKVQIKLKNVYKELELVKAVVDADYLINLPKLKTHGLTVLTCGPKNLYGCVPGLNKAKYHLELPILENFCELLVAVAEYLKPELTIVDGIIGMEGEGPSSGKPRSLGYLLASKDCFQVDLFAAHLLGINPNRLPVLKAASKRGLLNLDDLPEITGDVPEKTMSFLIAPATTYADFSDRFAKRVPKVLLKRIYKWLKPVIEFSEDKCSGCTICIKSCPASALQLDNKLPKVNNKECIHCYCCQELCPNNAVSIKKPVLAKWFF
ncbi:MAG: DUF362 domain-containing protein [Bacillota bacterium]